MITVTITSDTPTPTDDHRLRAVIGQPARTVPADRSVPPDVTHGVIRVGLTISVISDVNATLAARPRSPVESAPGLTSRASDATG